MALIIPPGYAQATLPFQHTSVARTAVTTWGIDVSSMGGDYVAAADAAWAAWAAGFQDYLDTDVTFGPVSLRVGQDGGDPLIVVGTASDTGDGGSASLPSNVALLIQKRTGIGGRRGRGRMYVPWIISDDSANDVGIISGAALPQYQAGAATFLSELDGTGSAPEVISMVLLHDSDGQGTEPDPTPVTSLTIDPLVATQRRRLARGG